MSRIGTRIIRTLARPRWQAGDPGRRRIVRKLAGIAAMLTAGAAVGLVVPGRAHAQAFPNRSVKIIVPFAPGGGNDVFARHLAARMTEVLKEQVIVENRAGAGGTIGTGVVAKAAPGKLTYASSGSGSGGHLAGKLLEQGAGISLLHVPYRGTAPALTDLLGDQVDLMFSVIPPAMPQVDGGKLRALAVSGSRRSDRLPGVPTVNEAGIKGYESTLAYGLMAPRGTPAEVLQTLGSALAASVDSPKLREAFRQEGAEPLSGTPAEFEAGIQVE